MKKVTIILAIVLVALTAVIKACTKPDPSRDYAYEYYCDSLWENDPDYYIDVLIESDEYLDYVEKHGEWW